MKKLCLILSLILATVPLGACGKKEDPTANNSTGTSLDNGGSKLGTQPSTSPDIAASPSGGSSSGANPSPAASGTGTGAASNKSASVELINTKGEKVGTAQFEPIANGIKIKLDANSLTPGKHGIHVHQVGKCDAPDFKSAGDHFNPDGKKHGLLNSEGPHLGDLPNIDVGQDGKVKIDLMLMHASLVQGNVNTLVDGDFSALVIHEGPDDLKTDPSGNSGNRIACGVIKP